MTWLDEHPEAVEAAAKAAYEASTGPWENATDVERMLYRDEASAAVAAIVALMSAAPVEYQWGVRHNGDVIPSDSEIHARLVMEAVRQGGIEGYELVRWQDVPVEVVDD